MATAHDPTQNLIISDLPAVDRQRLFGRLEQTPLVMGEVLYEAGCRLDQVFFPVSGIVSLNYLLANRASTQVAVVGNDGMVGIAAILDGMATTDRAVVQNAGLAYRLSYFVLKRELARGGILQQSLLRYTQALLTQIGQSVVSNLHYAVVERVRRWLLLCFDRVGKPELTVTVDVIADILGVQRQEVAEAIEQLQGAGAIRYSRGSISILQRDLMAPGASRAVKRSQVSS